MWLTIAMLACRRQPTPVEPSPVVLVEAPEETTGCRASIEPVVSTGGIVVTAHPEATRIGAEVLASGGSAADAAVAIGVALTLVEPQSSGLGGGAFLLHFDAATRKIAAWDGRETAPRSASPAMFQVDGVARPWADVVPGGRSVGVPGLLKLLEELHSAHGKRAFPELLAPTAKLAREGFTVTPRLARSIEQMEERQDVLRRHPAAKAYFYPDGHGLQAGSTLRNPALAATVEQLMAEGTGAFYGGTLGQHVVEAVAAAPVNPAVLTLADLQGYRAVQREPVCIPYAGRTLCGHPPPTSGGVTTLQILAQLERFELEGPAEPGFVHLFADSTALAWADRERYLADPAVGVPTQALLAPGYLADRSALLGPGQRAAIAPGEVQAVTGSGVACPEGLDTTHFVVADAAGNVVTVTSSIENAFGSGVFVDGYLLNNQLTDFARDPVGADGQPIANAAAACKRPRSSMAPTLVLDAQGDVELALGSPGGAAIIQFTARTLLGVLDQGLSLQQAIERPNVVLRGETVLIEEDCGRPRVPQATYEALRALGHPVEGSPSLNSGLHGIQRTSAGWAAGIDPRREGSATAVPPATTRP